MSTKIQQVAWEIEPAHARHYGIGSAYADRTIFISVRLPFSIVHAPFGG